MRETHVASRACERADARDSTARLETIACQCKCQRAPKAPARPKAALPVAAAAEGRAASGRCGRRPQHRCERADARDMERAARENRMRSRCTVGAEGARCAQRACGISPPFASICFHLISIKFGYSEWGSPTVAPPCVCPVRSCRRSSGLLGICSRNPCILLWGIPAILVGILRSAQNEASPWTT